MLDRKTLRTQVLHNNHMQAVQWTKPPKRNRYAKDNALGKLRRTLSRTPKTRALRSTTAAALNGPVCVCTTDTLGLDKVCTKRIFDATKAAKQDFFLIIQPFKLTCFMRMDGEEGEEERESARARFVCTMHELLLDVATAARSTMEKRGDSMEDFVAYEIALTKEMHASLISFCDNLRSDNSSAFAEIILRHVSSVTIPVFDKKDLLCGAKTAGPLMRSNLYSKRISNPFPAAIAIGLAE